MVIEEMPGWCAGVKVTALHNRTTFRVLDSAVERAVSEWEVSCLVVSVNTTEEVLIKTLKGYGFKKCPWVKNWGHSGRKTCLYIYQIPYKKYKELGGLNWDK